MNMRELLENRDDITEKFENFFNEIDKIKSIKKYGFIRIREIYYTKSGYNTIFVLKPKYAKLESSDEEIRVLRKNIKEIALKYCDNVSIKKTNKILKIIFRNGE